MSAVERMRSDLRYADHYRERSRALDSLSGILDCETPGTVQEVSVKRGRWFFRNKGRDDAPREIILSDDERREFKNWCRERSAKMLKQAEDIENRYAAQAKP
uniref:hypothetical protein n=1 Tax=Arthrobacter silvisoli TaxID=2291022 RepID=UPI003F49A7DA